MASTNEPVPLLKMVANDSISYLYVKKLFICIMLVIRNPARSLVI